MPWSRDSRLRLCGGFDAPLEFFRRSAYRGKRIAQTRNAVRCRPPPSRPENGGMTFRSMKVLTWNVRTLAGKWLRAVARAIAQIKPELALRRMRPRRCKRLRQRDRGARQRRSLRLDVTQVRTQTPQACCARRRHLRARAGGCDLGRYAHFRKLDASTLAIRPSAGGLRRRSRRFWGPQDCERSTLDFGWQVATIGHLQFRTTESNGAVRTKPPHAPRVQEFGWRRVC